jgi:hypothetical protein
MKPITKDELLSPLRSCCIAFAAILFMIFFMVLIIALYARGG